MKENVSYEMLCAFNNRCSLLATTARRRARVRFTFHFEIGREEKNIINY